MAKCTIVKRRMKAELLFYQRIDHDDGAIVEMVLWRVPSPVPPSLHEMKYSLFYGRPGVREVGYDNERGKGDHRHIRGVWKPLTRSPTSSNWWPISGPMYEPCEVANEQCEDHGRRRIGR